MEAQSKNSDPETLLLEIFSDDIPPKMQSEFAKAFKETISAELKGKNIPIKEEDAKTYTTPLRIAYLCPLNASIERIVQIKGPRTDSTDLAIEGFMQKHNIKDRTQMTVENERYVYNFTPSEKERGGELGRAIEQALHKSIKYWPKQMAWLSEGTKWVRPIHSIVLMLGNKVLPLTFAGIVSSNKTSVSRREVLDSISQSVSLEEATKTSLLKIPSAESYLSILSENGILMNEEERIESIISQIKHICQKDNLENALLNNPTAYQNLVSKNANMCERPTVAIGEIDKAFQNLPEIILEETMIQHQNYFPLRKEGRLLYFAFVFDGSKTESHKSLLPNTIKGNELVLSARLKDATYFLDVDSSHLGSVSTSETSIERVKLELKAMLSGNKETPTLLHRCEDINEIFLAILKAQKQQMSEPEREIATKLLNNKGLLLFTKLDLRTKVVNELTDLQGKIGAYYWKNWWSERGKEDKALASTIEDIILHQYDNDGEAIFSRCYTIANHMENILFHLAQNKSFSSSADPFGVQKSATNIITNSMPFEKYQEDNRAEGLTINIPLSSKEIEKILPAKYTKFASTCQLLLIKGISKALKNWQNGQATLIHQKQEGRLVNSASLWAEAISADILQPSQREAEVVTELFNRVAGLALLNHQQAELITGISSITEQTKQSLPMFAKRAKGVGQETEESMPLKAIDKIYEELESRIEELNESYKGSNAKLWEVSSSIAKLANQKELFTKEYLDNQDKLPQQKRGEALTQRLKDIKKQCSKVITKTHQELEDFLKTNIINTTDCIKSTITRKRAILSIYSSLLELFPWLIQNK